MALSVRLTWADTNYGESAHTVYRDTAPLDTQNLPAPLAVLGPGATEYEDTSVADLTTYHYLVSATVLGVEYFSDEISHTVDEAAAFPGQNIVAHYTFDNVSGSTVYDEEGGNDGTLFNASIATSGYIGDGLYLAGGDRRRMSASDAPSLRITGDLTISLWVRMNAWPSNWVPFVAKWESDSINEYVLRIKNSTDAMFYYGNGSEAVLVFFPSSVFTLGEWVHIAAVRKTGEYMRVYADGVQVAENVNAAEIVAAASTTEPLLVGCLYPSSSGDGSLNAYLDQLRLYDIALTPARVQQLADETG